MSRSRRYRRLRWWVGGTFGGSNPTARNKVVPSSLVGTTSSMRERREGPQRQQGFALGYLLSIVLVAVVVVLLAALLERLI